MAGAVVQRRRRKRVDGSIRNVAVAICCFVVYLIAYIGFRPLDLGRDGERRENDPRFHMRSRIHERIAPAADGAGRVNGAADHGGPLSRERSIPRIIWQTSKSKVLPPEANETVGSWRSLNPDYDHRLFDDADVEEFFRTEFPGRVHDAFSRLPLAVMKADMWRVAVVYLHGGVYADVDAVARRPVDEWVGSNPECEAFVAQENKNDFCNWAFAAAPGHPAFERALYSIVEKIERDGGVRPTSQRFVVEYTGPAMFTSAIRDVLNATVSKKMQADRIKNRDNVARENARRIKLCLFDRRYFNGINANNKFASVFWSAEKKDERGETVSSWTNWKSEEYRYYRNLTMNVEGGTRTPML